MSAKRKSPPVRDYMTRLPVEVEGIDTIGQAEKLMEGGGIRHIPVFNGSNLVGIVSDRDIREARLRVRNANKVRLDEICTRDVATVSPVASASEAVKTMLDRRIGSVVVVDGGFVVGIFTTTDALRVVNDYFR